MAVSMQQIISLIDLTSLNDNDTPNHIHHFSQQAITPYGNTAAVCVYPQFVHQAKETLAASKADIAIATVVNFPKAQDSLTKMVAQTKQALADGANEIDLVLPYHELLAGDVSYPLQVTTTIAEIAHQAHAKLKVIIESGASASRALITQASDIAIAGGADFVKTSTGKIAVGATFEACEAICESIKKSGKNVGIKLSGGIRTTEQTQAYLAIISRHFGTDWITTSHVRFGASSLLTQLLKSAERA